MKAEVDEDIKKQQEGGSDSLKKLEDIKTMDWHKRPIESVFEKFNYKTI